MATFLRDFVRKVGSSPNPPFRFVRQFFFCLLVATALGQLIKLLIFAGTPEALVKSDLTQDYVMGRALLSGVNSRLPFPDLVKSLLGQDPGSGLPHPSPHSPLITLLFIPIALLPLKVAHQLWILISAACGFAAFVVLGEILKLENKITTALLLLSLAILSQPGHSDLFHQQWNFQQMLIIALFFKAYTEKRFIRSAAYLSFTIALRPLLIPLCLFTWLSSTNRFRTAFILCTGAIVLVLFATLGADTILSYPAAAKAAVHVWEGAWPNLSVISLPANLALPMTGMLLEQIVAPVLPRSIPEFYKLLGGLMAVGLGMASVLRARNREPLQAMLSLLPISLLVSPVAWDHYLVILFIPLFLDGKRLLNHSGLRGQIVLGALILPMVYPATEIFYSLAAQTASAMQTPIPITLLGRSVYPLLTLLPILAWVFYPLPRGSSDSFTLDR